MCTATLSNWWTEGTREGAREGARGDSLGRTRKVFDDAGVLTAAFRVLKRYRALETAKELVLKMTSGARRDDEAFANISTAARAAGLDGTALRAAMGV
jgi:hypothetical protein